jgi:hypothetical protein
MSDNLRLPTMRQLKRMGAGDADKVLDWIESQLKNLLDRLPVDGSESWTRKRWRERLYRVRKRRTEYFGK